jgi:hypothetical protein
MRGLIVGLYQLASQLKLLSLCLPIILLMFPTRHFFLKNSYHWCSVISCRVECYQRSTQSFGMESMLFFVSHHMQKDITPGLGPQLISVTSVKTTVNKRTDTFPFFFSSDSYCSPIRMGRYSKCWNGACFFPRAFRALDELRHFPLNRYVFPKVPVTFFSKDVKRKHAHLSADC